jgi:hypothetical protein
MEVKAFTFPTRACGDLWEYRGRWGWHKLPKQPGKQAQTNSMNVKEYLKSKGVFVKWVEAVVVWAGEENLLQIQDPTVSVWKLAEIPERIEELWREQKLDNDQIQQCADVLKQVVVRMQEKISEKKK